jgi:hypothetical protein
MDDVFLFVCEMFIHGITILKSFVLYSEPGSPYSNKHGMFFKIFLFKNILSVYKCKVLCVAA